MVLKQAQKKREIRTRYLSHVPGLRTCHPCKDKQLRSPRRYEYNAPSYITACPTSVEIPLKIGDAYKHTPRTSTIASSSTGDPSVRSLERSDEALSKRLLCPVSLSHPNPHHEFYLTLPGVGNLAISVKEHVFWWNYGQETESPIANLIKFC